MKKLFLVSIVLFIVQIGYSQKEEFIKLKEFYQKEITLPITISLDMEGIEIDSDLLGRLIIDKQEERAKFYSIGDNYLTRRTTYGRIAADSIEYAVVKWIDEKIIEIPKVFYTQSFALGHIKLNDKYSVWVTKVVNYEVTFIDLYVFNDDGKLLSLGHLYENIYNLPGNPANIEKVFITSSIGKDKIIYWYEDRYNVKTKLKIALQEDGYLKELEMEQEGEFEY